MMVFKNSTGWENYCSDDTCCSGYCYPAGLSCCGGIRGYDPSTQTCCTDHGVYLCGENKICCERSCCDPCACQACDPNIGCVVCGNDPNKACCNGECYDIRCQDCVDGNIVDLCDANSCLECVDGNCVISCDPNCSTCDGNGECVPFRDCCEDGDCGDGYMCADYNCVPDPDYDPNNPGDPNDPGGDPNDPGGDPNDPNSPGGDCNYDWQCTGGCQVCRDGNCENRCLEEEYCVSGACVECRNMLDCPICHDCDLLGECVHNCDSCIYPEYCAGCNCRECSYDYMQEDFLTCDSSKTKYAVCECSMNLINPCSGHEAKVYSGNTLKPCTGPDCGTKDVLCYTIKEEGCMVTDTYQPLKWCTGDIVGQQSCALDITIPPSTGCYDCVSSGEPGEPVHEPSGYCPPPSDPYP